MRDDPAVSRFSLPAVPPTAWSDSPSRRGERSDRLLPWPDDRTVGPSHVEPSRQASGDAQARFRALMEEAAQRHRDGHDPTRPGYLMRRAQDLLNPSRRILAALDHALRQNDSQLQQTLWAFQPFSMSVGQLLVSALAGCDPQALAHWQRTNATNAPAWGLLGLGRVDRARLEQAQAHVQHHAQAHEGLWPYQDFALGLGELLRAALHTG